MCRVATILLVVLALGVSLAKVAHKSGEHYKSKHNKYSNGDKNSDINKSSVDNENNYIDKYSDENGNSVEKESNGEERDDIPELTIYPWEVSTSLYCGVDITSNERSLGSLPTQLNQYPWLVAIRTKNRETGFKRWVCGGSLISVLYVLTAAHCFNNKVKAVDVIYGENYINDQGSVCAYDENDDLVCANKKVTIAIKKIVIHPHYDDATLDHDIALVRLAKMAPYTDAIRPICLPSKNFNMLNEKPWLYVTRWGSLVDSDDQVVSLVKTHVYLPFVNLKQCQNFWSRRQTKVTSYQICAGGRKNKDACNGDSGGPLMYNNRGQYEITGVVSFNAGCGKKIPGVYTNVFRYKTWIMQEIRFSEEY